MRWPSTLTELATAGEPFVIVTVAGTRGSTPRETGAKLFVTPTRVLGTIGGGQLEYECTAVAAAWFQQRSPAQTFARTFTLGANCGQCCGGVAEVLFEQIVPADVRWPEQVRNAVANDTPAILVTVGDSRTGLSKRLIAATDAVDDDDVVGQRALVLLGTKAPPCRVRVPAADKLQVPADVRWPEQVRKAVANDTSAILVTVGDSRSGLSKRLIAATDAVDNDDVVGQRALALLGTKAPPCRVRVPAADKLQVPALFEPLQPAHFEIVLFGAGHVGSALVGNLAPLDCRVVWIDSRSDIFPGTLPANVDALGAAEPQRLVDEMRAGGYFLVMTHSHALDLEICSRILARDDFAYCGLIGSRSKRRQFEKRLRGLGLSDTRIARLVCPIGIPGITGKRPAEIAVAVTAQLLSLREAELANRGRRDGAELKKGIR